MALDTTLSVLGWVHGQDAIFHNGIARGARFFALKNRSIRFPNKKFFSCKRAVDFKHTQLKHAPSAPHLFMKGKHARLLLLVVCFVSVLVWVGFRSSSSAPLSEGSFGRARVAVVVLGLQLHSDSMPRLGLKRRVLHGVSVWRSVGPGALLVLSGARKQSPLLSSSSSSSTTEASAMAELAFCAGVPSSAVWLEQRASNTVENALFVAALLSELGAHASSIEEVVLVSSDWHLPRALLAFHLLLPPRMRLVARPAPDSDGLLAERLRSDLALLPATWRDVAALRPPPPRPLVWAVLVRLLGPDAPVLVAEGRGQEWSELSRCSPGASARAALLGAVQHEQIEACRLAPLVLCEAHELLAKRWKGVVAVALLPLSSTTWLYQVTCAQQQPIQSTRDDFPCFLTK